MNGTDEKVDIDEIVVAGEWALTWGREAIVCTRSASETPLRLEGYGVSVLRRQPDGS